MLKKLKTLYLGQGLASVLSRAITGSAGLRIVGMILGFLVGIQLARGLGAEGYGIYGVAMSIIAILTVPTEFGLPALMTREVSIAHLKSDWERIKGIINWANKTSAVVSAIIFTGILAWAASQEYKAPPSIGSTLLIGSALIPMVALTSLRCAALRGMEHTLKGQLPDVLLRPLFFSVLLFISHFFHINSYPEVAMSMGVLSAGASLLIAQRLLRATFPANFRSVSARTEVRAWWNSVVPMALTEGMRVAQGQTSILITSAILPIAEVGVYRVATSIITVLSMPITLFNIVGAPMIAKLYARSDRAKLQKLLGYLALGMTIGVATLVAPLLAFGEPAIRYVFGEEFIRANDVILVLGAGLIIGSYFGSSIWLLNMTGLQKMVMKASMISLILLATTTPILTLYGGLLGAASAASIAYALWNFLMWRSGCKHLKIDASIAALLK